MLIVGVLRHLVAATHLSLLCLGMCLGLHLGDFLLPLWQVVEPWVLKGIRSRYAHLWSELKHAVEQVKPNLVDLWQDKAQILGVVDRKVVLVLWQL